MSVIFYDMYVDWPAIEVVIQDLTPDQVHQTALLRQVDELLHYEMLTVILSKLPEHSHDNFLAAFKAEPAAEHHHQFLRNYIPNLEDELRMAGKRVQDQVLDAIQPPAKP